MEKLKLSALPHVIIYTDGACDPNPGPGGWAALIRYGEHQKELSGYEPETTNNRMELTAAIEALRALKQPCRVSLFTDSKYLKRGITEWLPDWRRRQWQRKDGPLANQDLWQALDVAMKPHQVRWYLVPGHAGRRDNELVDQMARAEIRKNLGLNAK